MKNRIARKSLALGLVAAIALCCTQSAQAQYGTSFYYSNPRTGFSYSQNVGVGNHSAYGGFSAVTNGRAYSAGSGYYGHNHYQHQYYGSPQQSYGYRSNYGPGYTYGRTSYGSRCRLRVELSSIQRRRQRTQANRSLSDGQLSTALRLRPDTYLPTIA